jgi:hypothetical protein
MAVLIFAFGIQTSSLFAATNSGIDTPAGITSLPFAVEGVEGMRLENVSPATGFPIYLGVGSTSPQSTLDVNGEVRPGESGVACSGSNVGAVRYNSTVGRTEVCAVQNGYYNWTGLGTPPGSVVAMAGAACPNGSLSANGMAYAAATYQALCLAISNDNGGGANANCTSGDFNVPDYRGQFLRGVSGTSGRDPDAATRTAMNTGGNTGDNVGSIEANAVGPHTHSLNGSTGVASFTGTCCQFSSGYYNEGVVSGGYARITQTGSTGASETRPLNAYVEYCIYY